MDNKKQLQDLKKSLNEEIKKTLNEVEEEMHRKLEVRDLEKETVRRERKGEGEDNKGNRQEEKRWEDWEREEK